MKGGGLEKPSTIFSFAQSGNCFLVVTKHTLVLCVASDPLFVALLRLRVKECFVYDGRIVPVFVSGQAK